MRTVLLIESDVAEYEVFRSVLHPHGFDVVQFRHPIEDLQHVPSGLELVVARVGNNGYSLQLVSLMQKTAPALKFVIVSHEPVAEWPKHDRVELEKMPEGSAAVLQAPVFPHELLSTIDLLLGAAASAPHAPSERVFVLSLASHTLNKRED